VYAYLLTYVLNIDLDIAIFRQTNKQMPGRLLFSNGTEKPQ